VIGNEAARQPHNFHVAPSLALEPSTRLNPVEIAVNVELQENRRVIRRPTGCLWVNPAEADLRQIKLIHEDIDHPNRIVLADPVVQAFG
jgi:hypothetical protein